MAWNPSPRVADCRDVARKWGMQQVVILGINQRTGKYEIASYGETKIMCAEARAINDRLNRVIMEQDYDGPKPTALESADNTIEAVEFENRKLMKENDRLRADLAAMSNSYHAANNERLALKGITAHAEPANNHPTPPKAV